MIEEYLIEILLSVVLLLNSGAYGVLWRRNNEMEEKIEKQGKTINRIMYRMFGIREDDTDEGHLSETEKRFDNLDSKLEEICKKIEDESSTRQSRFDDIEGRIGVLTRILAEEKHIDFDRDDLEEYQKS